MSEEDKSKAEEQNKKIAFENRICGNKKAYFFGYIYDSYMSDMVRHKNNYKKMCKLIYGCDINTLMNKPDKTQDEKKFLQNYYKFMPLMKNNCTMNVLANYVESIEFKNRWSKPSDPFDYHILMSKKYNISDKIIYNSIKSLISEFNKRYTIICRERKILEDIDRTLLDDDDYSVFGQEIGMLMKEYENKIYSVCSNGTMATDYLVDIYYNHFKTKSKSLLWGEFGQYILENMKSKSNRVSFPVLDENGKSYLGKRYSIKEIVLDDNI